MKVLQIVGTKKSGKTTVMLDFIERAKSMNLKVTCLKRAHEAVMDTPDTDSFRFAAAGADEVGLRTEKDFLWHKKTGETLTELIKNFVAPDTDLLLLEGFRAEKFPRLQLLKADEERLDADFYATIMSEKLAKGVIDLTTEQKRKDWLIKWLGK